MTAERLGDENGLRRRDEASEAKEQDARCRPPLPEHQLAEIEIMSKEERPRFRGCCEDRVIVEPRRELRDVEDDVLARTKKLDDLAIDTLVRNEVQAALPDKG